MEPRVELLGVHKFLQKGKFDKTAKENEKTVLRLQALGKGKQFFTLPCNLDLLWHF
jgi:hypothetical protein